MIYSTLLTALALTLTAISIPVSGNGGPTYVDACGVESSYAGETILVTADMSTDFVGAFSGNCIHITHSDVNLDCQGYRVRQKL